MVRGGTGEVFDSKRGYYHYRREIVSMLNCRRRLGSIGVAVILTFACGSEVTGVVSPGASRPITNLAQLISRLRSRGHKVTRKERVEQPFLSVKGRIIKLDDQDVQVFEYRTTHEAQLDASKISPTGSAAATSMPLWVAPPHFFKTGRLIVLYVGEDQSILDALKDILGPQFAGKSIIN